jgi:hypothetical protein
LSFHGLGEGKPVSNKIPPGVAIANADPGYSFLNLEYDFFAEKQ